MRHFRTFVPATLIPVLLLAFAAPAAAAPFAQEATAGPPHAGVISGTVTNGTTGQPMPDLTVELGIFDEDSLLEQRSARTDAAGRYRFDALPTEAGAVFSGRVEYPTGVPISSDFASFEAGQSALNLPITVHETTADPSGISVEQMHFLVSFEPGAAQITEMLIFSLAGSRTYIGDGSAVLRFALPKDAQGLQIEGADGDGGRFETTADGFVDKLALPPGQGVRQTVFSYSVPYARDELELAFTSLYPVSKVNALVSNIGQQATSQQLTYQGVRDTQMGAYHSFVAQDFPRGRQAVIAMADLPTGSAALSAGTSGETPVNRVVLWVLAGLVVTAAALSVILPTLRRRADLAGRTSATRERLVDALARLDLAYEAGRLSDAAYRDQRLHLKARLRDLVERESGPQE